LGAWFYILRKNSEKNLLEIARIINSLTRSGGPQPVLPRWAGFYYDATAASG
jgi:hypothetical protein